jgi:hypothetical protein
MPQGYYTIEQWMQPEKGAQLQRTEVMYLPFGTSLTDAENTLKRLGQPGLFRLLQMQRVIWAEQDGSSLRLRKSHAGSPQNLDEVRQMFDRSGGRFPIEEVKAARRQQKKSQGK